MAIGSDRIGLYNDLDISVPVESPGDSNLHFDVPRGTDVLGANILLVFNGKYFASCLFQDPLWVERQVAQFPYLGMSASLGSSVEQHSGGVPVP